MSLDDAYDRVYERAGRKRHDDYDAEAADEEERWHDAQVKGGEGSDGEEGSPRGSGSKPSKATQLVDMCMARYRLGCSSDGMVFAVERDGPNLTLGLRGHGGLRASLAATYFDETGTAPGQNPLSEALLVIEGMAMSCPREPVALRTARHGDALVIDMGTPGGRVIVVSPDGWQVADSSPVLFRRTEAIGPLPEPQAPGSLDPLKELLNVSEEDWPLVVAWLVSALIADIAHPLIFFNGEQGCAKTTASKLCVQVFDGVRADVQSAPRREDDWAVMASASWSIALDNMSEISSWLSDALCRAVTGAQWRKRSLYTDDGLAILRIKRVIAMNGISPAVARGDLAERLIRIDLEQIMNRMTDGELEERFAKAHPEILGGLLTLTAAVLNEQSSVETPQVRMADFARVLTAVDHILGTAGIDRYRSMVDDLLAEASEGDLFARVLRGFLDALELGKWEGSASELLDALRQREENWPDSLPGSATAVGSALVRIGPSLRAQRYQVERIKGGRGARSWSLKRPEKEQGNE